MTRMEALKKYGAPKQCPACRSCNTFERTDKPGTHHCLSCNHEWTDGTPKQTKKEESKLNAYTVVGIYEPDPIPFTDVVYAEGPFEAKHQVEQSSGPPRVIAVFEGRQVNLLSDHSPQSGERPSAESFKWGSRGPDGKRRVRQKGD